MNSGKGDSAQCLVLQTVLWMLSVLGLIACNGQRGAEGALSETGRCSCATLLRIVDEADGISRVQVLDAWQPGRVQRSYLLVPRGATVPADSGSAVVLRIPVRRAVALGAVYVSLLRELGAEDCVKGLSDVGFVQDSLTRQSVRSGKVTDVGSAMTPDVEKVVVLHPEVLLASPLQNAGHGVWEKTGVPIVECADYMEPSALGRAEWMRFFGRLVGRKAAADSLFACEVARYDSLRALAADVKRRPKLLVDRQDGGVWYVPGGESYLAEMYSAAGADYVFASRPGGGSLPLSFEQVFAAGQDADIWLVKYGLPQTLDYDGLLRENALYRQFRPFRQRKIFGCNTLYSAYYEEIPFHPSRLLHDFLRIFHPELLPEEETHYYSPL